MKVLFVSNLFPDAGDPLRGQVNATAMHHLAKLCPVRAMALRPALPMRAGMVRALQPRPVDAVLGPVFVPVRYVPKVGGRFNPGLYARSLQAPLRQMRRTFNFDVVLCAWLYPDGAALTQLKDELGAPLVHIVQGSDVHEYIEMPARRPFIIEAAERADAVITRSEALANILRQAGIRQPRLRVIYNGVHTDQFKPGDRAAARAEAGLPADGKIILYVGDLAPIKNPLVAVRAHGEMCRRADSILAQAGGGAGEKGSRGEREQGRKGAGENVALSPFLPFSPAPSPPLLVMIGTGALADEINRVASSQGSASRLLMVGSKTRPEVARQMQAADVLCIPSDNEGVPNVMLEAFATGLPVVATRVGGIPELLTHDFLGRLTPRGDSNAMADALQAVLASAPDSKRISEHAQRYSWVDTAAAYCKLLEEVLRVR